MNRYKAILKDKAASGGNETIIKGVQAAIQVVTDALSKAVWREVSCHQTHATAAPLQCYWTVDFYS
jgi:hypothetical protein